MKIAPYEKMIMEFYKALVESKFRPQLEEKWGKQFFRLAELSLKTFSPEIMDDLVKENKLVTEYGKLLASAKIEFKGEIRNLSQMRPLWNLRTVRLGRKPMKPM